MTIDVRAYGNQTTDRANLDFNTQQLDAIQHRDHPLRIIAGAGTGKTATLTGRFIDIVEQGDAGINQILALTFTRKAAGEMRDRILDRLNASYTELWVETFHAFCQRILRYERARQGLPPPVVLLDDARTQRLQEALSGHPFPTYKNRTNDLLRQALMFIDRAKDELLSVQGAREIAARQRDPRYRDLVRAYALYQQALHTDDREFDFGELQLAAIDILGANSDSGAQWRRKFRHILVDEYQDVNAAQARLIRLLAENGENLTVVGDVDQAIYAFRGASYRYLDDIEKTYPHTRTIVLNRNYRSHGAILAAANALISENPRDDTSRAVLRPVSAQPGPLPIVYSAVDEVDEARAIARRVADLFWRQHANPAQIAVLLRSVNVAGATIEQAIRYYDVPVSYAGKKGTSAETLADVSAVLRFIEGSNVEALAHILVQRSIDPLALLEYQHQEFDVEGFIDQITRDDHRHGIETRKALAAIDNIRDQPLPEQVYDAALICGRLPLGEQPGWRDGEYVQTLNDLIQRANVLEQAGGDRAAFIVVLERLMPRHDEPPDDDSAVQIMTVHAAKGLEFEHVFVAGLSDGRFPLEYRLDRGLDLNTIAGIRSSHWDRPDADRRREFLAEERRLGYVAFTRARKTLFLSHAANYQQNDRSQARSFPTFIEDVLRNAPEALNQQGIQPEVGAWSPADYARNQRALMQKSFESPAISPQALANLMLGQWTLAQLPQSAIWRPAPPPDAYTGTEPLRLSHSAMQMFETCPRQYYYGYVLKLEAVDDEPSPYLTLGTAIHITLEWMNNELRNGAYPTAAELISNFRGRWQDDEFEAPAQARQFQRRAEMMLRRYHAWDSSREYDVLETETSFDVPFGPHRLRGRIDAVIRHPDNTIEIIDYKSGRKKNTSQKAAIPQLAVYRVAFEQEHPDVSPKTSMYFMRHNDDTSTFDAPEFKPTTQTWQINLDDDQLAEAENRIAEIANRILANDFAYTTDLTTCQTCPYRNICEGAHRGD